MQNGYRAGGEEENIITAPTDVTTYVTAHVSAKLSTGLNKEGYTFPRHNRLLNSRDYQAVFRDNTCRSSDQRWTLLARHNNLDHARLGMAISKRIVKTAVERNRIKRIARESFRQNSQQLVGLDLVVMCKDGILKASNRDLFDSLNKHWQRVLERA